MGVAAGVMALTFVSLLIVGTMRPYSEQRVVIGAVIFVVLALGAVSYTNAFVIALPGGESDAKLFNKYAVELLRKGKWPDISIGTQVYLLMLTSVYRVLDPPPGLNEYLLVGQSLSIVAATATLVFIDRIAVNLDIRSVYWRAGVILVVGCLPAFLLHNALTFREPYQILGLAMGVYFTLEAIDKPSEVRWLLCAVGSLLFMGVFHHVLLGVSFVLIGISVLTIYADRTVGRWGYTTAAALVVTVGMLGYVVLTVVPATKGNDYVKDIREMGGVIEAIKNYRSEVENAVPRTSYSVPMDSTTPAGVAKALAANYGLYLVTPLGRAPERTADLVPMASSAVRISMLVMAAWIILYRRRVNRKILYCAFAYVLVTSVWSLGTTNYGQAFRHHAMSDWLLVVVVVKLLGSARDRKAVATRTEQA